MAFKTMQILLHNSKTMQILLRKLLPCKLQEPDFRCTTIPRVPRRFLGGSSAENNADSLLVVYCLMLHSLIVVVAALPQAS